MSEKRIVPLTVALAAIVSTSAVAADKSDRGTIRVSGVGEAHGRPDVAEITVGVTTQAETAQEAMETNNEAMRELFETLERHNIKDRDRQTRNFSVSPRYHQDRRNRDKPPTIVGYEVRNQVHIRVRELENLGEVLDSVVRSGANQISGINFYIDNPRELADQARTKAVQDAKRRAKLLADEAGVGLGKVLEIHEGGQSQPMPRQRLAIAEAASVPIAAGEETVTAHVSMVFVIAD